jgi:glucose/arabinose dehydrogenase
MSVRLITFAFPLLLALPLAAQTSNPIPTRIGSEGVKVELVDWLQAPATASSPRARLSTLKPAYDGTPRLFVNDLRGLLYVIASPAANSMSLYLDVKSQISVFRDSPGLGTGLTGFAFHPQFAANGRLYTAHMESAGSGRSDYGAAAAGTVVLQGVITEWTATSPTANVFAGTRRELLRIDYNGTIHGLQDIGFNPFAKAGDEDYGLLYICAGDGGAVSAGRPDWTHRLSSPYGSILRLDPLGTNSPNGRYGIPSTNPYANDGRADTLGEIYAWGFRNPHRISWDSQAPHRALIGDIGENQIEEVNLLTKGGDYGYPDREGTFLLRTNQTNVVYPLPADDATFGFTYPVAQYDHDEGAAIAGGYVYRGANVPALRGLYFFGDIPGGRMFYVKADTITPGAQSTIYELGLTRNGSDARLTTLAGTSRADVRFGIDLAGEVYIMTKGDGRIRRVAALPAPPVATGKLINVSTRGRVETGERILIAGFVVEGGSRRVVIRGVGPALGAFGVTGFLADPEVIVLRGATVVATNDNWGQGANAASFSATAASSGAFPYTAGSADAGLLLDLDAGAYTVQLRGRNETTGVALVEVYEAR